MVPAARRAWPERNWNLKRYRNDFSYLFVADN
jgi:hypothetical protein